MAERLVGASLGCKYDCGFLDKDGNFVGLTLVRDPKTRIPRYQEVNDPAVASQFFTGQVGYANLQAQKEIQEGQDDWRSGFGLEYQDQKTPKRYFVTHNVDARFKGMAICAPKVFETTLPAAPIIQNGNFESWTDEVPDQWTYTHSGTSRMSRTSGYSGRGVSCIAGRTGTANLEQYVSNFSSEFIGKTYTLTFLCRYTTQGMGDSELNIRFGDNVGYSSKTIWFGYSEQPYPANEWFVVSLSHTVNADATSLYVRFNIDLVQNGDDSGSCKIDNVFIGGGDSVVRFEQYNGNLYFALGGLLYKYTPEGEVSFVRNLGFPITDLKAFIDGNLYIATGGNADYQRMNTSETFTTVSDSKATLFAVVGSTMKKTISDNKVYSTTNPSSAGSWDTGTAVGSVIEHITGIEELSGLPYIMKEDMPYYIEEGGEVRRAIPSLIAEKSPTSGKNAYAWQNRLYIPCGAQALYEYNEDGVVTDISPSKYVTNNSDFDGRIVALAGDAQWLFAFLENGDRTEILAGRWETVESGSEWVWHPIVSAPIGKVTCAKVSTVYKRRLWFGTADGGVYYIPLTSMYGNITADTDYRYQAGGHLDTCWIHSDLKGDLKAHYKITLTMKNTSENAYWQAYYQKLGDTEWTKIGDFKESPYTTMFLPEDEMGNKPQSTMLRYRFVPITAYDTETPVLLNFDVRGIWYPHQKKIINMQVRVADNMLLNDGSIEDSQSAAAIRQAIEEWKNPAVAYPRAFFPLYWQSDEDTVYAKLQPTEGVPFCLPINGENGNIEWVYNLNLLVVDGIT